MIPLRSRLISRILPVLLCAMLVVVVGCAETPSLPPNPSSEGWMVDQTERLGIRFEHRNGMSGALYFHEIVGPGGALFDYDNDGDLDLYLVQGRDLGHPAGSGHPPPWNNNASPQDRLFRNDLQIRQNGDISLHFTDVTEESGIAATGYGMGAATGDLNNDGWIDLYVTNFGSNQLWLNNGPGEAGGPITFSDVTSEAGVDDPRWSTSAAIFDVDQDGWLDLFATQYVDFRITNHDRCVGESGAPDYCGPRSYEPETDRLWHNRSYVQNDRTLRLEDVSGPVGLSAHPGPGLGAVAADFDHDGRTDFFVANDQAHNYLWLASDDPDRHLRFRQEGLERGVAVDGQGRAQASMGVDVADIDRDGDLDLFMTHLLREVNTLYLNDGGGWFDDRSSATGLGTPSIGFTGFGAAFLDLDNDGWLDLLTVNGEVRIIPEQQAAGVAFPLAQPNQLFMNHEGRFVEASNEIPSLHEAYVSRGLIIGDLDNDGDADAVICNNSGPVQILINQIGQNQHWLGLRLLTSNRDAIGAEVNFHRQEEPTQLRLVTTNGSYLSAKDPRILFGLGANSTAGRIKVRWPSGKREVWDDLPIDRYHTLVEGQGHPEPDP